MNQNRDEELNPQEQTPTGTETEPSATVSNGNPVKPARAKKEIVEWIKALAIAGVLVFVIRTFLFSPFIVDGSSMLPSFESGERVIVNKILYDIRNPQRGEVVVFHVPEENRDFIKRVIGVPGDKVRLEGDSLYVNDELVEEPYLKEVIAQAQSEGRLYNTEDNFPNSRVTSDTVPEGMILAFGDNRGNSRDSRSIGFVSMDEIVGRADLIFWPMDKIKIVDNGSMR